MEKELKDGMYVISPISNLFFTKGKKYKVEGVREISNKYKYSFDIASDLGGKIHCILNECSCIDCKDWIISDTQQVKDTFTREDMLAFGLHCAIFASSDENTEDKTREELLDNWIKENL